MKKNPDGKSPAKQCGSPSNARSPSGLVFAPAQDLDDPEELIRFAEALLGRPVTEDEKAEARAPDPTKSREVQDLDQHGVRNSPQDGKFASALRCS